MSHEDNTLSIQREIPFMNALRYALVLGTVAFCLPAATSSATVKFMAVTITDIGRPYSVIDGECAYGPAQVFEEINNKSIIETAMQNAAKSLIESAKKVGADAIVGMQFSPIVSPLKAMYSAAMKFPIPVEWSCAERWSNLSNSSRQRTLGWPRRAKYASSAFFALRGNVRALSVPIAALRR